MRRGNTVNKTLLTASDKKIDLSKTDKREVASTRVTDTRSAECSPNIRNCRLADGGMPVGMNVQTAKANRAY